MAKPKDANTVSPRADMSPLGQLGALNNGMLSKDQKAVLWENMKSARRRLNS